MSGWRLGTRRLFLHSLLMLGALAVTATATVQGGAIAFLGGAVKVQRMALKNAKYEMEQLVKYKKQLLVQLDAAKHTVSAFGRYHALVIGNQNYQHLTPLHTPLADAKAVAEVLEKQYGFEVALLLDANREQTMRAISKLRSTLNEEEDNLLIYYAGHGYLDVENGVDYWQPVDSEKDINVNWFPTSEINNLLTAIRARHILIVADSCYAGSLLMRDSGAKLPTNMKRDEWLKRMQQRRSRTALTSGGKEPVLDSGGGGHSVFAKAFLEVLRENQEILDGDGLFDRIKGPVADNARQTPLYGVIQSTGHDQGDFLLVPKELQLDGLQSNKKNGLDKELLRGNSVESEINAIINLLQNEFLIFESKLDKGLLRGNSVESKVNIVISLIDNEIEKRRKSTEENERFLKTLQDNSDKSIENDFQFGGK